MRLLTVTHFYEAHGGGIERVAGRLNHEFTALGHETSWAASAEDALPETGMATPVPLPCWNLIERVTGLPLPIPGPTGLHRLRAAIRASDAVVVHDALYASSIAAMLFARRAGKPVLLVQHIANIPFSSPLLRVLMALANRVVTRPMLQAADRLVFISETTRRAFAEIRTRHVPQLLFNGVDTSIFHPGPSDARAQFAVAPGQKLLLFVGRFVEKKGMRVLERVARARPDWRFLLAGQGPIDPRRWGLANVTVVAGRAGASLAALYRGADLLVLPSVGEGYPLVVQEAMACGLPVLCGAETAVADPGAGEWLRGVDIALADPGATSERVIAAVETLSIGAAARARMSAYAAQAYDWRNMAARIVEEIRAV